MRLYICAYCKEYGHYINKCKHPNINILLNNIKQYAIIHLYCTIKHNFNYLLYKFNTFTIQELRIIAYNKDFNYKLSNAPNKKQIQEFIIFLVEYFSLEKSKYIYIPYFKNDIVWDYATDINKVIKNKSTISIYKDIIKISPRPLCYDINMVLNYKKNYITEFNDDFKCVICFDNILNSGTCIMNCKHSFCINCTKLYLISLYKHSINDIYYQPNCPLCRTIITSININEYFSYLYFKSTFSEKFIPDYFNQINENQLEKVHTYEEKYYYINQVVEFNDDDIVYSPYNLYIPTNIYAFEKIGEFIRNNVIIYRLIRSLLGSAFLFCIVLEIYIVLKYYEKEELVLENI